MQRLSITVGAVFMLSLVSLTSACELFFTPVGPSPEAQGLECGEAPASFDGSGDVVQAAGAEGCVRIERKAVAGLGADGAPCDACAFEPRRLVLHVDGFTRRYDIDTTELTYEASEGGWSDVVTTTTEDDVAVRILFDICTGAWNVEVDEGEVSLPVVGT